MSLSLIGGSNVQPQRGTGVIDSTPTLKTEAEVQTSLPYARTRYWIMLHIITVNDKLFLNAETYALSGSFVERGIDIQLPDVSPTRNVDWCNCACAASRCDITELSVCICREICISNI